ncbi:MAG: zinc ribbon domain-containing protein [Lachnospiraceae bacterium]|nr:zinc ribbon domain-containing protein [Lachnospiraceae bacterium]
MFCRNCGAQNNDNSNFCRECGSPLKVPAAAAVVENVAEAVQETAPAVETAAVEAVQEAAPAVEAAAVETVQDVAETVENTAETAVEAANETISEVEMKAENVTAEEAAEAAIAGEEINNVAETAEIQVEETVAQAETTAEQAAENITEEAGKAEGSSAAPAEGVAAVSAVAAELISEAQAKAAEPAPQQYVPQQGQYQQPAQPQQYTPQQGQYQQAVQPQQYAPQQGQYQQPTQPQQYAPQQGQYQQPAQPQQYAPQQGQYHQQAAPQQGYYSNEAQAQPKPPKKKAGAGRVILTIFLSLFLIIFFTVCIVEYSALKTINKDNLTEALKKTDISQMVFDSDGEELSLVEVIEDKADIDIAKEFDIPSEQLEAILDTPTVKEFVSGNLADMAESVLNGEEPDGISKKTIIDYVKKNKKAIYKDLQGLGDEYEELKDITMEDIENFEEEYGDQIDDAFDSLGTDKIDMNFISEETGMDFDISKYIKLVPVVKWIAPGLAALFIILMLIGNIGYESLTGKGVGISAMIAGIFTAGAAAAFKFILDIPDSNVLKVLGMPMADMMLIVGGIAFGGGLLLLIITCIIKAIANRARA